MLAPILAKEGDHVIKKKFNNVFVVKNTGLQILKPVHIRNDIPEYMRPDDNFC